MTSLVKWVSSYFVEKHLISSKNPILPIGPLYIAPNPRFYGTETKNRDVTRKIYRTARREAQAALLEYLHFTRNLEFVDAKNMSENSPHFLGKILEKVGKEGVVKHSVARFLRYHPINEFEPFFESLGLRPCEYIPLLPRDLMLLSDDDLLLENYHVLSTYGVSRSKIGRIFVEAMEVFRYEFGVLQSKLQVYEERGVSQSIISKIIVYNPHILIGDANEDFVKVNDILKGIGIEFNWMEKHLLKQHSCNWSLMLNILSLLGKMGCSEEELCALIKQHPELLIEGPGNRVLELTGILLKLGYTVNEIQMIFLQLPQVPIGIFSRNLQRCFQFFSEIKMKINEIRMMFLSHLMFLGSCNLKKTNSLCSSLSVGKKRLRKYIMENPQEMKKWVMGSRVGPLPDSGHKEKSQMLKTKFLEEVGFVKDSDEMEKALVVFGGREAKLQQRFDCIVDVGLDKEDVYKMVRRSPQILNQTEDVIKSKIDFLVNDLGYAISFLLSFPQYLKYTTRRIKLRLLMYDWLKDEGTANPNLAFNSLMACSDKVFERRYVNHHPRGSEVWKDLRKKTYSGSHRYIS